METYRLLITPQPAPRPRIGRNGAFNTPRYRKYKNDLIWLIKAQRIPTGDYGSIRVVFHMPIPKSVKANPGDPHRKKPDNSNLLKALEDALEQSGIINNDSQFWDENIKKVYGEKGRGWIEFQLG